MFVIPISSEVTFATIMTNKTYFKHLNEYLNTSNNEAIVDSFEKRVVAGLKQETTAQELVHL